MRDDPRYRGTEHSRQIAAADCPTQELAHDAAAPPEIAVFGEWNTTNLGDRGIHDGVQRFFAGCGWRMSSFAIGSLTPVSTQAARRCEPVAAFGPVDTILGTMPAVKRLLREARQRVRIHSLLAPLKLAQAILVGGGELLSDADMHFPQSLSAVTEAAMRLDKPLYCIGCSAGGKWSQAGERVIRRFLNTCTALAMRDHVTAERVAMLLGRPVPVFGDFCLDESWLSERIGADSPRRALAINVQQLIRPWNAMQKRYEDCVVSLAGRLCRAAAQRGIQTVRIFTTGTAEDSIPARRVFMRLEENGAELHLPNSVDRLKAVLASSALVVASRLHAGIYALAEGAAVVGYSPRPKLGAFLASMGMGEYAFDLDGDVRLLERVGGIGFESLYAQQRSLASRSAMWRGRAELRTIFGSIARSGNGAAGPFTESLLWQRR